MRRSSTGVLVVAALIGAPSVTATPAASTTAGVVFERITGAGNSDVVVATEAGTDQKDLTTDSLANDSTPSFAPGGGRIVFASDRTGRFGLWTMSADGSRQKALTPSGGSDVNPHYSPDGKWIAFACSTHGNLDICVVAADGTGRRNLTGSTATELDPSWSADSTQIVFDRIVGRTSDIWSVGPKGGTPVNLTRTAAVAELDPSLSPSGDLAFDAMDATGNYDVYVRKAGSSAATRLTTDPRDDSAPVFSPDGMKILYVSARTGDYDVWEMNADGSGKHDVSKSEGVGDVAPSFAPPTRDPSAARGLAARTASFPCALNRTNSGETIKDTGKLDRICAKGGGDTVYGLDHNDLVDGGYGNDTLYGGTENDTIYARACGCASPGSEIADSDKIWGGGNTGSGTDTAFYDPTLDVCHSDVEHCRTTA